VEALYSSSSKRRGFGAKRVN